MYFIYDRTSYVVLNINVSSLEYPTMKRNDMYTLAAICLAEKIVAITNHYLNISHREQVAFAYKTKQRTITRNDANEIEKRL